MQAVRRGAVSRLKQVVSVLKEWREAESTGTSVLASLLNLCQRLQVVERHSEARRGVGAATAAGVARGRPSDALLLFRGVIGRMAEVHVREVEKQAANVAAVLAHLNVLLLRCSQLVVEGERAQSSSFASPSPRRQSPLVVAPPVPLPSPASGSGGGGGGGGGGDMLSSPAGAGGANLLSPPPSVVAFHDRAAASPGAAAAPVLAPGTAAAPGAGTSATAGGGSPLQSTARAPPAPAPPTALPRLPHTPLRGRYNSALSPVSMTTTPVAAATPASASTPAQPVALDSLLQWLPTLVQFLEFDFARKTLLVQVHDLTTAAGAGKAAAQWRCDAPVAGQPGVLSWRDVREIVYKFNGTTGL